MIIDAHCHFLSGNVGGASVKLSRYLRRAARAGISHHFVWSALADDYEVANRALWRWLRGRGPRFTGFAFVHAARDASRIATMLRTAVLQYGFRGVKVHRRDAPLSPTICEWAQALGVPIVYDPMGEMTLVRRLARRFPDVRFVLPHFGSFYDDWRAQSSTIDLLQRLPNVWADTSAMRHFDLLRDALRRVGVARILFGTDGPYLHPGLELAKIAALGLSPEGRAAVLEGNARRLLQA